MLEGHDSILAVDIGGTNIRAGIVRLLLDSAPDLSKAKVWKFELWRHGDEKLSRDEAVDGIVKMLNRLINQAKKDDRKLAPFIRSALHEGRFNVGDIHDRDGARQRAFCQ
jgi:hexokinase